ncbi:hypothetical protein BDY24DRAFT_376591 [Mrakia frigida]|uniref:uncharacterized protein n=1 Tax=Mrakia frigida TaxID=29902 RepID=UPI003FCC1D73
MRFLSLLAASLSLVSVASAQLFTSTLPWDEGNTLLVSATVNAAGVTAYVTVSTIAGGAAAVTTTATGTRRSSSASTTATTTAVLASGEVAAGTILDYSEYASIVAPSLAAAYSATASSASSPTSSSSPSLLLVSSLGIALAGTFFGAAGLLL